MGMAVIFITHDLAVVSGLCDRVLVMYAGRVVEAAEGRAIFRQPRHPYTRALLRAIPSTQPKGADLYTIPGLPPDLSQPLPGCPFAPRCEFAVERCRREEPSLQEVAPRQSTACLRAQAGEI
jgi:oligopeptide transport system ATP-binding protein